MVDILHPIPPGLDKDEFFDELQQKIETATQRLLQEGRAAGAP
jgi:1-acyl-sn-glycerol-3-phosphate acyltransferase